MSVSVSPDTAPPPPDPLSLPEAQVFKHDARSRVWLTRDARGGAWVVKRFEHRLAKQRLTAVLKCHPAQAERRWHERLAEVGLPVVPIVAAGIDASGRHWLVTPYVGDSLFNWLRCSDPAGDAAARHNFTRQLGHIIAGLVQLRLRHRDCKASNFVIDRSGRLRMIDAGAIAGARGTPVLALALRMLGVLHANLAVAASRHASPRTVAITRADRLRCYHAMREAFPAPPDGLQHLPRCAELGG